MIYSHIRRSAPGEHEKRRPKGVRGGEGEGIEGCSTRPGRREQVERREQGKVRGTGSRKRDLRRRIEEERGREKE